MPLNPPKIPEGCVEACVACGLRSYSKSEAKDFYQAKLSRLFSSIEIRMAPDSKRWGYREKVLLYARRIGEEWQFGLLRRRGWEKDFIWIPDCPVHSASINSVLSTWAKVLPLLPLHFLAASGSILTLVIKEKRNPEIAKAIQRAAQSLPPEWSLWINWNPSAGNRVFDSKRFEWMSGSKTVQSNGFFYGPSTFRQQIAEMQLESLGEAANFFPPGPVVDFYSGLGISCNFWQKLGHSVIGVELGGESIEFAQKNAPACTFLRGRVEDRLPQVDEWIEGNDFNLYVNPPRGGLHLKVIEWILKRKPSRIAYLSCNPKTLKRDLDFCSEDYDISRIKGFEFFPQTTHLECLALLKKKL